MNKATCLISLGIPTSIRDTTKDGGSASDGVCLGLILGLLLRSNLTNLIQITLEHCGIGNILGRLGQLQENNTGANLQETHDDRSDLNRGTLETLEQDSRSNDSGAGKHDIVSRSDERSIENIQRFLQEHEHQHSPNKHRTQKNSH
jgi:hypothetical protein